MCKALSIDVETWIFVTQLVLGSNTISADLASPWVHHIQSGIYFFVYRGGQRFAGDSDSPISIVPHLKLTSVLTLKELIA